MTVPSTSDIPTARPLWHGRAIALIGILLVAVNLRTLNAMTSPIIPLINQSFPIPVLAVSVLGTTLPLAFAIVALVAPRISGRLGLEPTMLVALGLMVAGQAVRILSPNWQVLSTGTLIAAFGTGLANVVMSPIVKKYFPDRIGLMTTIYMSTLMIFQAIPAFTSVPVSEAFGWRSNLMMWAVIALTALVPWLIEVRSPAARTAAATATGTPRARVTRFPVWKSPTGMAIAVMLAIVTVDAYAMFAWLPTIMVDIAGVDLASSGALTGVFALGGLISSLTVPWMVARFKKTAVFVYVSIALALIGYGGLLLSPTVGTILWAACLGVSPMLFPLSMALINLRTRSPEVSLSLSGFSQVLGYGLAILGPLGVGILHEATGGWTWVLIALAAKSLLLIFCATVLARESKVEDDVRMPMPDST